MFGTDDPQVFIPLREDKELEKIVIEVNYLLRGREVFEDLLAKCQVRMQSQDSELYRIGLELQAKNLNYMPGIPNCKPGIPSCKPRNSELQAKNSELHVKEGEIQQLTEQLKQQEGFIDLITHSRSWKLTKPLRMIKGLLHGEGEKHIMKRRLQIIRKIFLVLFWALRFRIFRLVDFVRDYLTIERSGLFDAEFLPEDPCHRLIGTAGTHIRWSIIWPEARERQGILILFSIRPIT